ACRMCAHGVPRQRARRATVGRRRDERAAACDGSDALFGPMQSRPPDVRGAQAYRHRTIIWAAIGPSAIEVLALRRLASLASDGRYNTGRSRHERALTIGMVMVAEKALVGKNLRIRLGLSCKKA